MIELRQVAGIVLAAGFSRRLGRPKQTVVLGGETLVERAARTAVEAGFNPVLCVIDPALRDTAGQVLQRLEELGCRMVVNAEAAEGMASSIRCGVEALPGDLAGAVVLTCDQVAVTADHLRALCSDTEEVTGSGYVGKVGVPAFFPARRFADLLSLRGDQGARDLLLSARCVQTEALALDIDTDEELRLAEAWVAGQE